jgi:hypothetical protein
MDRTRSLREVLNELHAALEESPEIEAEGREALRQASAEIAAALDEPDGARTESLRVSLERALERFERSHPKLTSIVGRIADALSDLGI